MLRCTAVSPVESEHDDGILSFLFLLEWFHITLCIKWAIRIKFELNLRTFIKIIAKDGTVCMPVHVREWERARSEHLCQSDDVIFLIYNIFVLQRERESVYTFSLEYFTFELAVWTYVFPSQYKRLLIQFIWIKLSGQKDRQTERQTESGTEI